jgi:hypothetical protein
MIGCKSIKPKLTLQQVELVSRRVQFMAEICQMKLTMSQVSTDDNCLRAPYLAPAQIVDSWGSLINLKYTTNNIHEFVVTSAGQDKLLDTSDDIIAEVQADVIVLKFPEDKSNLHSYLYSAFLGFICCLVFMILARKLKNTRPAHN